MPGAPLSSDFATSAFVAESRTVIGVRTSGDARPAPPFGFSGDTHGHESRRRRNHYPLQPWTLPAPSRRPSIPFA